MEVFSEANKIEMEAYDLLKTVIDPELGINIIDLGLVYKIQCTNENEMIVELTLSSKGCPMGDVIMESVETALKNKFPEMECKTILVWEPKWTSDFVTPAGKKALGFES